jgi:hypothetical protein
MNDHARLGTTPSSEGHAPEGTGPRTDAERRASRDEEPDMQDVLDAVAVRLDEVLALPGEASPDDAVEAHEAQAAPEASRLDDADDDEALRSGGATGDGAPTDEAERRLRAARERMTQRHAEAREEENAAATRTWAVPRGVSWVGIVLIVLAAVAAVVIVWLR